MYINIAVTGRPCSGKSSLISCMYKSLDASMPGYFRLPETEDFDAITGTLTNLERTASGNRSDFESSLIKSNNEEWEYDIFLKDKDNDIHFMLQENTDIFDGTKIFVSVIDTPLLMNGHEEKSGVKEAIGTFTKALESSNENKLLIIVPLKCEAYTRRDYNSLISKISDSFKELAELSRTKYRGRSAIAVIPVHTMGGASFYDFVIENGNITAEKFRRDKNVNFRPEFADNILRFAVNFLLHEGTFSNDIQSVRKISDNAVLDDNRFDILCGRELLEPEAPKKNTAMKIVAVVSLLAVLIITGYIFMRQGRNAQKTAAELQETIAESVRQNEENQSRAQREITEARNSEEDALNELNKALTQITVLKGQKSNLEKQLRSLQEHINQQTKEIERLQQQISSLKQELDSEKKKPKRWTLWPF